MTDAYETNGDTDPAFTFLTVEPYCFPLVNQLHLLPMYDTAVTYGTLSFAYAISVLINK